MPVDTIYAVSSGRPPAAIAVMRISGPRAYDTLLRMAGGIPEPRAATLRSLRSLDGDVLDRALVFWFPGPKSATGEDVAELHLHGGVAVVRAVSRSLSALDLRHAEPGEFTRRAVINGRLGLNEAEGLADLLEAETESQRREAILRATGVLSRDLDGWAARLLTISADIERVIDHDDGEATYGEEVTQALRGLHQDIRTALERPAAERLRDGVRVAIVGPANAGKSSLFNALVGADAAIVTPLPGTTRDAIERPVSLAGLPFLFIDTAGQRPTDDMVERLGIERAAQLEAASDIILDLSPDAERSGRRIAISAKADVVAPRPNTHAVSVATGEGIHDLVGLLSARAESLLPPEGEAALNARQRQGLNVVAREIGFALTAVDLVLQAAHLYAARDALDRLTGRAGVEDLLDTLFARFCLGK